MLSNRRRRVSIPRAPAYSVERSTQHYAQPPLRIGLWIFLNDKSYDVWLNGVVVSALGIRARRPQFESRVAPLFHWVATLGKLPTQFLISNNLTGVQKGSFRRQSGYRD